LSIFEGWVSTIDMSNGHQQPPSQQGNGSRESYSLDEMMTRLKEGESGGGEDEGELVTRSDGSQALRKRRRKRRSEQPHKKEEAVKKKLLVLQLGGALLLFFLVVIGALLVFAKFNSRGFTGETQEKIGEWTSAETEVDSLSVSPQSAKAKVARLNWKEDSFLNKAVFQDLQADLKVTNLVLNKWEGKEVLAEEGTISLKKALSDPKVTPIEDNDVPYRYQRYRCRKTNILFGETKSNAPMLITGMESSLKNLGLDGFQLTTNSGRIKIKGLGEFDIYRGTVLFRPGIVNITSFQLQDLSGRGDASLSGSMPMTLKDQISLALQLEKFPLSSITGSKVGRIFGGDIESDQGRVIFNHGDFDSLVLDIPFESSDLTMRGFPFLAVLAEIVNESNYSKPVFSNRGHVDFKRDKEGNLLFRDLYLERKGLIQIKGGLKASVDGSLSGSLRVGLPNTRYIIALRTMAENGSKRTLPFSALEDGYHWVTLDISGTVDNPDDNFADLLRGGSTVAPLSVPLASPEQSFEDLTR